MTGRVQIAVALIAMGFLTSFYGGEAPTGKARPGIHYLEIVSNDVDTLCATYERVHALSFGPENPDFGHARVAVRPDGSPVGIRRPLAEHEQPTMRTYLEVVDIHKAVEEAESAGAIIAYPPTRHGELGTFAIFIQGDVEHGLWQR